MAVSRKPGPMKLGGAFSYMAPGDYVVATNAAAAKVLTPAAGQRIKVRAVLAAYTATPTGGMVTISGVGAPRAILRRYPVTAAGPAPVEAPGDGWAGLIDEVITVTLAAGGAGIDGHLNVDWTQGT